MPIPLRNPERILRRLEWTVIRRLDGLLHGDYRTIFRGAGLDLADLREYQYHDDVRRIDWNVTARLDAPYVREYYEDRDLTAWFLVDLSASTEFGSRAVRKASLAQDFVAVVAQVLSRHGNRVAAALWRSALDAVIAPGAGRRHVLRILRETMTTRPAGDGQVTDLGAFLAAAQPLVTRRSLVFVISDFISRTAFGEALGRLAERHEVIAVRLHDPLEAELPDLGLVTVEDAETGEQLFVDTHDRAFRRRFGEASARREAALRRAFRDAGVDALELATDANLGDAILRFADLRRQRSRLSAGAILRSTPARRHAIPVA